MSRAAIRKRAWGSPQLTELATDVQREFDRRVPTVLKTFVGTYEEPMTLAIDYEPSEIRVGRALIDASPETVVSPGHVHFTFMGAQNGVRINDIAGLTPGTRYRINFMVVG